MSQSSDPRAPFVIGIVVLGAVLLAGMIWAVASAPSAPQNGGGVEDPNLSFNDANDPSLGSEDANVTLHIFGDFECPACRAAEAGITYIRQNYADRVHIVWNDFPLPPTIHPKARDAANAARCADEQGKFWEMHDVLYETQTSWSASRDLAGDFAALANRIGLDENAFRACYGERRHDKKVADDLSEGRTNGVDSTPTFFVNNTRVIGVRSPSEWDTILAPFFADQPSETAAPNASTEGEMQLQL